MRGPSFRGGVVPPHRKKATEGLPIEWAPVPGLLKVPVSQHLGAPGQPLVEPGERVERGQPIAGVDAPVSAPVHAPVTGTVSGIEDVLLPSGMRSAAVLIESDEQQDLESFVAVDVSGSIPDVVRAAGIVGMGGAQFPSAVKLAPPGDLVVDSVILNGCECEPFLTCDHRTMLETPRRVVAGARHIARAVGAKRTVIGVEDNKPDAIAALMEAATDGVEVLPLAAKYPQGAEKQLIWAVLGREVPKGKLPAHAGALVHNVGTAAAIADAVEHGRPLMDRVVTVTGAVRRPGNYRVLLGTSIGELIEHAGGLEDDVQRVIAGGPMTGFALGSLDVPVVKGTSGVVAMREGEAAPAIDGDQPCIRCGRCAEACPSFLLPFALGDYARCGIWTRAEEYHALDCIECGSCAFVCPTRRPLLQLIRLAKGALLARGVRP